MTHPHEQVCILIPFHHRQDLLLPLLKHLKHFPVCVVDDGEQPSDWAFWKGNHPTLQCIRAGGSSGFTSAVNIGLKYIDTLGYSNVLLINDDAWISIDDLKQLFQMAGENRFVSPVIQTPTAKYYGASISSWGRIRLNTSSNQQVDALLGACLLMPSRFRLDERFYHGFEDFHLTYTAKQSGMELVVLPEVICKHLDGGTLQSHSPEGLRYSVFGHLCFYDSFRRLPLIYSLYVLQLFRSEHRATTKHLWKVHQGVVDWLWRAIAARIASSKLGSSKIK